MIKADNLVKTFESVRALDGLNMNVPAGSVYGLVGPNGAGKSTLLRHVTGIYRQDSGEILINGEPVFENIALKERMAFIPDDVFYYTQATVKDLYWFYKGIYKNFDSDRYARLGDAFGNIRDTMYVRKLSRGMQKQVAFRLALSMHPDLLVLDEPVDGLDPVMRRQVWSLIMSDVADNGMTVLVSSHNLRELEDVCDCVGIMNKGKMLLERGLSELQENLVKIQTVPQDDESLANAGLNILHEQKTGRLRTLIIRGTAEETEAKLQEINPVFTDILPLTLEEIFIYELGGENYEVKDIVL